MAEINEQQLLELAKKAAIEGGAEIMEVYQSEFAVSYTHLEPTRR